MKVLSILRIALILFNISALYKSFTYLLTREYRQEFPVAEVMENISYWFSTLSRGWTIQPKLDRTDPVKSAASESAIQYRSDTESDLHWTVRK